MEAAHKQFAERVKLFGGDIAVAKQLGVSRGMVWMLRTGARTPGMKLGRKIEDVLAIPMRAWSVAPSPALATSSPVTAANDTNGAAVPARQELRVERDPEAA